MIDSTILKTELETDPARRGYAPLLTRGAHNKLAVLLNEKIAATVDREFVTAAELFEQITASDFTALDARELARVQMILGLGPINLKNANVRAHLAAAFGAGTQTRANITALQGRAASRAEVLFGAGTFVTVDDIAKALDDDEVKEMRGEVE